MKESAAYPYKFATKVAKLHLKALTCAKTVQTQTKSTTTGQLTHTHTWHAQERSPKKLMKDTVRQLFVKEWGQEALEDHPELRGMFNDAWHDAQLESVVAFVRRRAPWIQW
jgi:hypothetical protein